MPRTYPDANDPYSDQRTLAEFSLPSEAGNERIAIARVRKASATASIIDIDGDVTAACEDILMAAYSGSAMDQRPAHVTCRMVARALTNRCVD